MPLSRAAAVAASTVALLALPLACADDDAFDPSGSAEQGIHDQVLVELGLESEVVCDEPATTDVGAIFDCTATDVDGKVYTFVAEIFPDQVIGTRLD